MMTVRNCPWYKRETVWAYIMLTGLLTVFVAAIITMPPLKLAGLYLDDGFYYLTIARNAANGNGFTFDGINPTNGFQPLWLYSLIPLLWFLKGADDICILRAAYLLQALLLFAGGHFVIRVLQKRMPGYLLPVLAYFLYFVFHHLTNGMESALYFLLFFALLHSFRENTIPQFSILRGAMVFGLLPALLFLTRLDSIFFTAAFFAAYFFLRFITGNPDRDARASLTAGLILFAVIAGIFLNLNYRLFGTAFPISGILKTSGPTDFHAAFLYLPPIIKVLVFFTAGISVFLITAQIRKAARERKMPSDFDILIDIAIPAGLLGLLVFLTVFGKWAIYQSHFLPFIFFFPILLLRATPETAHKFFLARKRMLSVAAALVFIKALHNYSPLLDNKIHDVSFRHRSYEAALWANTNLPKESKCAMKDCGTFGYFFRGHTINLDGLVNNLEYQEAIRDKRLNDYLRRNKVRYLVHHSQRELENNTAGNQYFQFKGRYYSTESDPVFVSPRNVVFRSEPYNDNGYTTVFTIWRLEHHR